MAKKSLSYEDIIHSIQEQNYVPIYGLMGDESYFIDCISDYIEKYVLSDSEKEFNQTIMYGGDVSAASVIEEARRYPMMSSYRVLIIKEAQMISDIENLLVYFKKVASTTLLVLNYKYGKIPRSLASEIEKNGILFESKKLYDNQIPNWIKETLQKRNYTIEYLAAQMMAEYLGTDLGKLSHELDKLIIYLQSSGQNCITAQLVENSVGISKEFNNFELVDAILNKDILKANRIVCFFDKNPKNVLLLTTAALYGPFSSIVVAYGERKDQSEQHLMEVLNMTSFQFRKIQIGMRNFSPIEAFHAISLIREYDAKSKGVGNSSASDGDLLKELVYKLLH